MIKKATASLAALLTLAGSVWATLTWLDVRPVLSREFNEVAVQVAANTQGMQLQRWQYLNTKREHEGLAPAELLEYCALSRALGFQGVGCA